MRYNHKEIEEKWQKSWDDGNTFKVGNDGKNPKYYVLDMFPYPSGKGLHVGHPKGYVGSDIVSRYKRMRGFDVLHPMGWDAFGLPAERQSHKEGIHPSIVTTRNIETFRKQLQKIGLSYDWDREISTCDEKYYKWTQWIFLKLFERGLAYQAEVAVNWCPALGTVLANEEVKDGVYIETGDPVEKRLMKQWMLKITAYADRLIDDLKLVDWPESVKEMQRNWIGRSEGARVKFEIADTGHNFEVFTTRPDTLFGCTYAVLAPEHPIVRKITTEAQKADVEAYIDRTMKLSEKDRLVHETEKTGVFTGAYAVCPVNNKKVELWIADYVLTSYGTGAVFACPAHDERDHEFAKKFNLPIIEVVKGGENVQEIPYTEDGEHVNSEFLDGLNIVDAKTKIISWLSENNFGKSEINYRLRDWLFSRQRYWGEPIPVIITEDNKVKAVSEKELPITLPYLEDFSATSDGQPPLARAPEWVATIDPETGKPALRETNTMPQWAGSCWYYLRFIDPHNENEAWSPEAEKRWGSVDLYIGGTEHATLHLLYARFWHKVLYDLGVVSSPEPFTKLFNQGMIIARSYKDSRGKYYYPYEVDEKDGQWYSKLSNELLETRLEKMSKSRYNVVTPDEIIEEYGADSLRLYEMFIGPLEDTAIWQTENIQGVRRFLDRTWRLFFNDNGFVETTDTIEDVEFDKLLHKTIKKVTEDIESIHLNTAISQLMILVNEATKFKPIPKEALSVLARLISPFAPHISEEFWSVLGNETSITYAKWPEYDPAKTLDDQVNVAVQVNGKLRHLIDIPRDSVQEYAEKIAKESNKVNMHLEGKTIVKVIFVKNKLLNFVVK